MSLPETFRNRLLKALPNGQLERLMPLMERVQLEARDLIEPARMPFQHVYFPEDGVVSVVCTVPEGKSIEVGVIGREGMTGVSAVLGDDRAANESFVQIAGDAWRLDTRELRRIMHENPALHAHLLRYVKTFMVQMAQTALANGQSTIEERLARWLLMVHDRIDGNHVDLTHDFLATMLGARRPGVTVALHVLEGQGLIRSKRAQIAIADRDGLEEFAGGYYGIPEVEYRRLIEASAPDSAETRQAPATTK